MNSLRVEVGQQAPPAGGYSIERFEGYLDEIGGRIERLKATSPHEAVFEITYLTFSKQVLSALKARRFEDMAWATDMACRFIEVYKQQTELWKARDPRLCRSWRVAFEAMEEGRINVIQAMLLGINAHINYDLAFVSLGACRYAGDLANLENAAERSLSSARSGVPTVRYRDFLVINQLEWEAIEEIQDVVLKDYSSFLYWGNRLSGRGTRFLGQRMLMEMRDSSWYQTTLLIHAREGEERALVSRLIDSYAAGMADLIGSLTYRPDHVLGSALGWMRRGERIDPELQAGIVDLAINNPVIAELAVRELAFGGADPVAIMQTFMARGQPRLAGVFGRWALKNSPWRQKQRLARFFGAGSASAVTAADATLEVGEPVSSFPEGAVIDGLRKQWTEALETSYGCLELPEVASQPTLSQALAGHVKATRARLAKLESGRPVPVSGRSMSFADAKTYLANHSDRWVRTCALAIPAFRPAGTTTGEAMASLVERVLFLKETQVFMEVDISVLMHVAENLEAKTFNAGVELLKAGEKSGGLYLITDGKLEVSQKRDGRRIGITTLGPRDSVGELSVLNDTSATADCTALTPVKAFFLSGSVLSNLLHEHPRLSIGLMRMLSHRLMSTTQRVQQNVASA
ncbi:MAG: cyclic nucleotide-binding domain-containing protein [Archangium sp.]|nr:cyclic nucleotide-binding domain-containing protein [Archangium sp.]